MKFKKIFSLFCLLIIISNTAFADLKSDRQKLQTKRNEKKIITQELNRKKREINQISSTIRNLDAKIHDSEEKIGNLKIQVNNISQNIDVAETNIKILEKEISDNEDLLKQRIRLMYKTSDISYLQLLLESNNIKELLSNAYNVQKILNSDKEMLETLEAKRTKLKEYKNKLINEKKRIDNAQVKIKAEQYSLENYKVERQNAKNSIQKDIQLLNIREKELQRESNALEQRILAAIRASGSNKKPYSGGKFAWPLVIRGKLTSPFGWRTDPINGFRDFHRGQDISAPGGTGVVAVADGTVITSRYQGSYGNVVMIDHGGGISTVYAHNSALLVREGSKVRKGQLIARVGTTGRSTGNHLHFEVRINGKLLNPMQYY